MKRICVAWGDQKSITIRVVLVLLLGGWVVKCFWCSGSRYGRESDSHNAAHRRFYIQRSLVIKPSIERIALGLPSTFTYQLSTTYQPTNTRALEQQQVHLYLL
ncbi:hypothetical protein C8R41DRAFT_854816 [Lentinula lateritia]|uniref:Secreted protein n=1 Tax=Lentinula lateritia TaxID=40482 RepID=A0ABQ8V1P4_9AGAR|nr:hypothetical protein C8R41DRAFT_854816 [Lentinula lateritia]